MNIEDIVLIIFYSFIGFSIILFIIECIIKRIVNYYNKFKIDNAKTLEELQIIIKFECECTYKHIFIPLFKDYGYSNKTRTIDIGKIISDNVLNDAIVKTSKNIIENLSEDFINKLSIYINKEKIEEFIVEIVRTNLIELALNLNEKTINKMKN